MDLIKGTRLGGYELVMRIGRGGMASVWVAQERTRTRSAHRLVAIKAMLADLASEPEFVSMFLDEVRLVSAIRHPNVVDVYDVGEQNGVMWMAMEWIEGESLHGIFAEATKRHIIPMEIAVRVIADAAAGLHAAHELRDENGVRQNVVHRDVSPQNVLINTRGEVKLVDFGVAKAIDRISEKTRTGHLKGKFGYMSPEQVRGRGLDRRSDIFSLGVVLYELTTGRRLFRGRHDVHTLQLVASGHIPQPSSLNPGYPPELERIVMKALDRRVGQRHPTAAAFEAELREFLSSERILVARSGVASLLTRVVGPRLAQRRRALEQALTVLELSEKATQPDLTAADSACTPGSGASAEAGDSSVSSLSQMSPLTRTSWPDARGSWQGPLFLVLMLGLVSGYFVYQSQRDPGVPPTPASALQPQPIPSAAARRVTLPPRLAPGPTSRVPLIKIEELDLEEGSEGRRDEPDPAADRKQELR